MVNLHTSYVLFPKHLSFLSHKLNILCETTYRQHTRQLDVLLLLTFRLITHTNRKFLDAEQDSSVFFFTKFKKYIKKKFKDNKDPLKIKLFQNIRIIYWTEQRNVRLDR